MENTVELKKLNQRLYSAKNELIINIKPSEILLTPKLRSLSVGRDEYSKLTTVFVIEFFLRKPSHRPYLHWIYKNLMSKKDIYTSLRWVLRGLTPKQSVLKCNYDFEVGMMYARYR